mgnify:CR=1 FL=1
MTDVSCFGYDDGEVSLVFSVGNTENATYYFNNVETDLGQYLYVSPGDYVAYGVDGNGCISDEVSIQISSPEELILEAVVSVVPFAYADSIDTSPPLFQALSLFIWEFGNLTGVIFLLVFIRELVKDIEDLDGDRKAGHATLPITYSPQASWRLINTLLIVLTLIVFYMQYEVGFGILQGIFLGIYLNILRFSWKKKVTQLSAWLKLLLAAGLAWLVLLG